MPRVRLATLRAACSRSSGEAVPGSWIPETRFLGPDAAAALLSTLPPLGLSGSAVYDALVAAAARELFAKRTHGAGRSRSIRAGNHGTIPPIQPDWIFK